ncbi:MAG: response regulator [Pseudomonadota bacterium]
MSFSSENPGSVSLGSLRRQCLFAVTILLVEDSRSASEAIRLFAAESGARVRRADSLHAASRHLAIYRPNVVIVDLGLPDGDGMSLIKHLASASTPIQGIIALSGHDRAAWQEEAMTAGASACIEKPIPSLKAFQTSVLSVLPDADTRRGPDEQRNLALMDRASMQTAFSDDLIRAKSLLDEAMKIRDNETIAYCAQFVHSVGDMLDDGRLGSAAEEAAKSPENAGILLDVLTQKLSDGSGSRIRGVA